MFRELHRSESRGLVDMGWLKSRHSFSFGHWYDPNRMGVGALRVINDDWVEGGHGFYTHPHRDMEIVSIPLQGALRHEDSMGHQFLIDAEQGDVQRMTAGTGIRHSEYNADHSRRVNFLQIWVMPRSLGIAPSYQQKSFPLSTYQDATRLIVSPDGRQGSVSIHQEAFFSMMAATQPRQQLYQPYKVGHFLYIFVIEGRSHVGLETLHDKDALAMELGPDSVTLDLEAGSRVLLIEVPPHP